MINFLAKHLYRTITERDLLRQNKSGRLFIGDKMLNREQEENIREEAERLQNSVLWKLLVLDVKHNALQKTLHKAETIDDVIAGKLMLYIIDVIETRLSSLKRRG